MIANCIWDYYHTPGPSVSPSKGVELSSSGNNNPGAFPVSWSIFGGSFYRGQVGTWSPIFLIISDLARYERVKRMHTHTFSLSLSLSLER